MYKEFRARSHTVEERERFVIDISEIRWEHKLLIMPYSGSFIVSTGDHHPHLVKGQGYVEFRLLVQPLASLSDVISCPSCFFCFHGEVREN